MPDLARRREGLELAPLLERHAPRSAFHLPLFTAVVHNYPALLLARLFAYGLPYSPAITVEHMALVRACLLFRLCLGFWWPCTRHGL